MADQDWANLVGRFMLASGDIESTCTYSIKFLSRDGIGDVAADLPLERRITILCEILARREDDDSAHLLAHVKKLRTFLKKRNLLAHNGLSFTVKKNGGRLEFSYHISSSKNQGFKLTYSEMEKLTLDVEFLQQAFTMTCASLWAEVVDNEQF